MQNNMIAEFQRFMQSPAQYMAQRGVNVQDGNPQAIIQQLMDSGRINQAQYDQLRQRASEIQSNPLFQRMFKR